MKYIVDYLNDIQFYTCLQGLLEQSIFVQQGFFCFFFFLVVSLKEVSTCFKQHFLSASATLKFKYTHKTLVRVLEKL